MPQNQNPVLAQWLGPYGLPPFGAVAAAHYRPAFEQALAEHRAEIRRQESEAQQQRWRRDDDQRQIAKSICDSREQLNQIIQAWTKTVSIEQFLRGVEERASNLSEAGREVVQERLRLAREFIGVQDPLEFLLSWKSPAERYVPLATRKAGENL